MNENEEKLISAYMAGEDVDEKLLQACRENPNLLKDLADFVATERLLQFDAQEDDLFVKEFETKLQLEQEDQFTTQFEQKLAEKQKSRFNFLQLVAAACLILLPVFYFSQDKQSIETPVVASIAKSIGNPSLIMGNELNAGPFTLDKGYAELTLKNGVQLTLEAPIKLDFKNPDLILLHEGNLVANVPKQAIGFTVLTPSSEIIDLGTEFAVGVSPSGASEVHVMQGEVKARSLKNNQFVNLFKDDARAFDAQQQMSIIESNPMRFRRSLPGESPEDPDFLHWSFDDQANITTASGKGFDTSQFSGELKTLNQGQGPIYENGQFGKALFFNGKDAYVETAFKGIGGTEPRTVAFWAKIPEDFTIDNGYGMISWGLHRPGKAWQISPNPLKREGPLGRLRIGTMQATVVGQTDLRDRRWHHIAIVMYGGSEVDTSTHILLYIDGKLENTSHKAVQRIDTILDHKQSRPLIFGRNMAFDYDNKQIRQKFFRGWLDEIFIFDAALDQEQIQNLMNSNSL
ncbi:FecR domain-containing protein [Lentisphaera marina]|uniref:LamG-like jellyroll fold domain-containing protein n=1 Tax=Lentisphaera marina TaxID=1111041 RepID=UPI002365DC07|nr:LamG-like jellyroll fold domain-containing protein [Lentisphaera marina]MDD7983532.1 FecR domain-containing protein [Lentisphaera marina]